MCCLTLTFLDSITRQYDRLQDAIGDGLNSQNLNKSLLEFLILVVEKSRKGLRALFFFSKAVPKHKKRKQKGLQPKQRMTIGRSMVGNLNKQVNDCGQIIALSGKVTPKCDLVGEFLPKNALKFRFRNSFVIYPE